MPIVDATPPPAKGANTSGAPRAPRVNKGRQAREDAVAQLGMFAQVPLIAMGQHADVGAISLHWPGIAKEIAALAESDDRIAQVIDPLIKVGPYAGLIAAVLPLVLQIGVNHGRLSPGAMGTQPAVALASQVEAGIAQQELAAMRMQLDAEREARKMRDEIDLQRREMTEAANQAGGPK